MSNSVSYDTPGSRANNGDCVKTTNDCVEVDDKGAAEVVAAGKPKAAARTFVTLDVKPWGMLVGTNIPNCNYITELIDLHRCYN
jgi:hypothetical protein